MKVKEEERQPGAQRRGEAIKGRTIREAKASALIRLAITCKASTVSWRQSLLSTSRAPDSSATHVDEIIQLEDAGDDMVRYDPLEHTGLTARGR